MVVLCVFMGGELSLCPCPLKTPHDQRRTVFDGLTYDSLNLTCFIDLSLGINCTLTSFYIIGYKFSPLPCQEVPSYPRPLKLALRFVYLPLSDLSWSQNLWLYLF